MKSLQVKEIRELIQGELISGSELWYVRNAIYYKRHDLTKRNTLMFVSRSDSINWLEINNMGPSLVISDKPHEELKDAMSDTTVIKVKSLVQAYWGFMDYYRKLFQIPVVTITGTCGKTTTKEMIKHILSEDRNVHASISSKNEPRQSLPYLMGINESKCSCIHQQ